MTQPRLPYYKAPTGLEDRVRASLRQAPRSRGWRPGRWGGGAIATGFVLLVMVTGVLLPRHPAVDSEARIVLDAHLRSLVPGHLTDVASTDQHTVKPWFAGKLDFSPPVTDPAAQGFPLVGGRLDVVDGRTVAVLVYSRRNHLIGVFVRPALPDESAAPRDLAIRGYNLVSWLSGGMRFWAVSDLNAGELAQLQRLLQEPVGSAASPP